MLQDKVMQLSKLLLTGYQFSSAYFQSDWYINFLFGTYEKFDIYLVYFFRGLVEILSQFIRFIRKRKQIYR